MEKHVLQQAVSGIVVFFLSASVASGATFYVRTNGNNANTGTANTSAGAWLTITYAASHVSAGDVVRVQPGTYVERVSPTINGTSGNTVTLVADGTVTTCGLSFSGKSYIRIIGFTLDPSTSGCSSGHGVTGTGTNTGLEFWNVTVQNNPSNKAYSFDRGLGTNQCVSCIFVGGTITNIGGTASEVALLMSGNDSFIGYIGFSAICYVGIGPSGSRVRMVNNNFSALVACNGTHPDNFYIASDPNGYSNSLIESTFGIGTVTSTDNKGFHAQNQTSPALDWNDDVWRLNVNYNLGSGYFSMYDTSAALNRWRFYNNSLIDCVRAFVGVSSVVSCGNMSNQSGHGVSAWLVNNLIYQGWTDATKTNLDGDTSKSGTPAITKDYSLAFSPLGLDTFSANWTAQAHPRTNIDPKLNNVIGQDFTLQSSSGARGVGGPLTTTNGSGSNSTTLTVAANTGSFFIGSNASNLPQYGGQLVPGDFITVGSTTAQVASVSGDTLTLVSPISWTSGAPVYFGSSSTVDIGAYPFKSGGYALSASSTISGGTATITPNDASLVRFVVCYSDSVPYAVANSSPYTCPAPAGTFSARVYPRYASQTQSVTAAASGLSAPTNLRIVG